MSKEVTSAYFHIDNGGVSYGVVDDGFGPKISVKASHFGNQTLNSEVAVNKKDLIALSEMFAYAASYDGYSEDYCMAANLEKVEPYKVEKKLQEEGKWKAPQRGSDCCGQTSDNEDDNLDDCQQKFKSCCQQFPVDDEFSMHQGDFGTANLDIWYNHQFVQNEQTNLSNYQYSEFQVNNLPIVPGTLVGTVYLLLEGLNRIAIQTFIVNSAGVFVFSDIGKPFTKAVSEGSSVDYSTGVISLKWNQDPGTNFLVLSYEYSGEFPKKESNGCCRNK